MDEKKLKKPYFASGTILSFAALGDEHIKKDAIEKAIPEFMRFNIVESEIRNVC